MAGFFLLLLIATLAGVPQLARPMSPLDYADAIVSSFVMVFVFTLWVGKRIESRFVLHGALVGGVAVLLFVMLIFAVNKTFAEPPPYIVAHAMKILGGITGSVIPEHLRFDEYGGLSIVVLAFASAIFTGLFCGICLSKHQSDGRASGPRT